MKQVNVTLLFLGIVLSSSSYGQAQFRSNQKVAAPVDQRTPAEIQVSRWALRITQLWNMTQSRIRNRGELNLEVAQKIDDAKKQLVGRDLVAPNGIRLSIAEIGIRLRQNARALAELVTREPDSSGRLQVLKYLNDVIFSDKFFESSYWLVSALEFRAEFQRNFPVIVLEQRSERSILSENTGEPSAQVQSVSSAHTRTTTTDGAVSRRQTTVLPSGATFELTSTRSE